MDGYKNELTSKSVSSFAPGLAVKSVREIIRLLIENYPTSKKIRKKNQKLRVEKNVRFSARLVLF